MSWKKNSSNTKRNGSIYASKVFTENIVVHNKAELDSIDISIINYPKDNYDSSFITISDVMKCNDLSVDVIRVHNGRDTSGVVKFIKSISAPAGMFNILKAKDGCFNNVDVSSINYFNTVRSYNNDIIEVSSNSNIFNSHSTNPDILTFNDVCVNNINETNSGVVLTFLSDICINYNLLCKDISINVLDCLNKNDFSYINIDDICVNGMIYATEISANNIKVCDLCVNIIQSDTSINFKNNVVCNHGAQARAVYIDNITSDVSINGDVSINSSLTVDKLILHGNIGKPVIDFSGNAHLRTSDYKQNTIITNDICVNIIASAERFQVPITPIGLIKNITTNPEITTYGIQENVDDDVVVIDGDISYETITADWVKSGLNIIPVYNTLSHLVAANDIYEKGQIVAVDDTINESGKLFIKIDDDFWHILETDNGTAQYKKITLSGERTNENIRTVTPTKTTGSVLPDIKTEPVDNSYTAVNDNEICVFYLHNKPDFSNDDFTVNIETGQFNKSRAKYSISFDDISFQTSDFSHIQHSNIVNTGELSKWGVDVSRAMMTMDGDLFDFSNIIIRPPVNNGFDLSFHINIIISGGGAVSSKRKLEFKKLNLLPVWSHMKFDVSNKEVSSKLIGISGGDQSWNDVSAVNHKGDLINDGVDDASCVFYVRYFKPSSFGDDVSYYFLDLSAIDPEGYDVSYRVRNDDITQDGNEGWSWNWSSNWSSNDSSRIEIKIPGEGSTQNDFSFTILADDNSEPDVSNLIPPSYYSHDIDSSKRTIFFKKVNDQPTWNYMKFGPSNDNISPTLDVSWNNDGAYNSDDVSIGLVKMIDSTPVDLSKHFLIYYDSCRNNIYGNNVDLSYYYLDLSATDHEGFDVSYDISCVKDDLSFAFVGNDTSRIVIDISSSLGPATLGGDTSLAIISLDDWTTEAQRPNPFKRIANFTYITPRIINLFDISENKVTSPQHYNNLVNDYSVAYITNHITIEPSYQSHYSTYISASDYSVNDITFTDIANQVDIEIKNNKIDINTAIFDDISFSFILFKIFKYNFNLYGELFSYKIGTGNETNIILSDQIALNEFEFINTGTNEYTFLLKSMDVDIICKSPNYPTKLEIWHFIGSGGGGGGAGGYGTGRSRKYGYSGGGGAGGFVIQYTDSNVDYIIENFKVSSFSAGGEGGDKGLASNTLPAGYRNGGYGGTPGESELNINDAVDNNNTINPSLFVSQAGRGYGNRAGVSSSGGGLRGVVSTTYFNSNYNISTIPNNNNVGGGSGAPGTTGINTNYGEGVDFTASSIINNFFDDIIIPNGGAGGRGGDKSGSSDSNNGEGGSVGGGINRMFVRLTY